LRGRERSVDIALSPLPVNHYGIAVLCVIGLKIKVITKTLLC